MDEGTYRELFEEAVKILIDCRTLLKMDADDRRLYGSPFFKTVSMSLLIRIDEFDKLASSEIAKGD